MTNQCGGFAPQVPRQNSQVDRRLSVLLSNELRYRWPQNRTKCPTSAVAQYFAKLTNENLHHVSRGEACHESEPGHRCLLLKIACAVGGRPQHLRSSRSRW